MSICRFDRGSEQRVRMTIRRKEIGELNNSTEYYDFGRKIKVFQRRYSYVENFSMKTNRCKINTRLIEYDPILR